MTQFMNGLDALNAIEEKNESTKSKNEMASMKSGAKYLVKVIEKSAVQRVYAYGDFSTSVHTFVAKNPSDKTDKGFPTGNLTPWDKAYLYHKNLSEVYTDKHGAQAGRYRPKPRFAIGFYDLDAGKEIIVDLTKNQAQQVADSIKKYEKKIGKIAFELSKTGESTGTVVSLSPIIDMDEDLTDKQRANFESAPATFDMSLFDGIWYEMDEAEQLQKLTQAGFDIALIGASKTATDASATTAGGEIAEEDLPF